MTVQEIIDELTEHGFEDTSTAQKLRVINDTMWDIESREPWPFLEKTTTLNFDGSSPTPTNMPTDFKAVLWLYDNTNGMTIWPERLTTIRDRASTQISLVSDPVYYYFVGSTLKLWPIPGAATGRYQLDYMATQTELNETAIESAILMPPRHHRAIVLGSMWRLYKQEDDPENGGQAQADYESRLLTMREDLFKRQYQRADQIFVIDEDDEFIV